MHLSIVQLFFVNYLINASVSLVPIKVALLFGFIFATIDIAMVPNYANIVDMHLVFLQVTTCFGFICAIINTTMMPNYANIVNMHLV